MTYPYEYLSPRTLDAVTASALSPESWARRLAAQECLGLGGDGVEVLALLVRDGDAEVRVAAVEALAALLEPERGLPGVAVTTARRWLVTAAEDDDARARECAHLALHRHFPDRKSDPIQVWTRAWQDSDRAGQLGLAALLLPRTSFALEAARVVLETGRPEARLEAARRLRAIASDKHEDVRLRSEAAGIAIEHRQDQDLATRCQLYWSLRDGDAGVVETKYAQLQQALIAKARPGARAPLVDCLHRTLMPDVSAGPVLKCDRCIVVTTTPGFEGFLDRFLSSLHHSGNLHGVTVAVFTASADDSVREVIRRHGAVEIACDPLVKINASIKGVQYSAARVIEARQYLSMECDMLVLGDISHVFAAIDAAPPEDIVACPLPWDSNLRSLEDICQGDPRQISPLLNPREMTTFCNGGLLGGTRAAFLRLDAIMRSWQPWGSLWLDEMWVYSRDENLVNVAMGVGGHVTPLSPIFNMVADIGEEASPTCSTLEEVGGVRRLVYGGEVVKVAHFMQSNGRAMEARVLEYLGESVLGR